LSKCHLLETQTKDYITTHDIVIEGSKFCYGGYTMNYNKLNPQEERVIVDKATEPPFSGEYDNFYEDGTFICRRRLCFYRKASLMQDVDGQALTKTSRMQ